jgi:hypothetical protein
VLSSGYYPLAFQYSIYKKVQQLEQVDVIRNLIDFNRKVCLGAELSFRHMRAWRRERGEMGTAQDQQSKDTVGPMQN